MNKSELLALKKVSERIRQLASLKNAGFSIRPQEDEYIKDCITPYMTWFTGVAYHLDELIEAVEKDNKYGKRNALDYIINHL